MVRMLLRRLILWALQSEPVQNDAAGMDKVAWDSR